jgi:hypothetical protein
MPLDCTRLMTPKAKKLQRSLEAVVAAAIPGLTLVVGGIAKHFSLGASRPKTHTQGWPRSSKLRQSPKTGGELQKNVIDLS